MTYDPRKAAQTIAYFALKSGGEKINVLKAVKLVYLADRESVRRFGFPIQDEARFSLPNGPVNSETYRFIKGEVDPRNSEEWSEFLSDRENHDVGVAIRGLTVDQLDELSDADLEVLEAVWERFGAMTQWQLVNWTHLSSNVPEWEDPNGSSQPIPLLRLMTAVGVPDAAQQAAIVEQQQEISRLLKGL